MHAEYAPQRSSVDAAVRTAHDWLISVSSFDGDFQTIGATMNNTFARTLNELLRIGLPGAVVDEPTLWRRSSYLLNLPVHLSAENCTIGSERFRVRRGERHLVIQFYPAHLVEPGLPSQVTEGQGWTIVDNFGVPGLTMTFELHRVTLELPVRLDEETCQYANQLITALVLQKRVDVRFISDPFAVHNASRSFEGLLTDGGNGRCIQLAASAEPSGPDQYASYSNTSSALNHNQVWDPRVNGVDVNQVMNAARLGFCIWHPPGSDFLVMNVPIKANEQECQRRTEDVRHRRGGNGRLSVLFPDASTIQGPQFHYDGSGCVASFPLGWEKVQRDFITRIVNRAIEGRSVQINFVSAVGQ